MECFSYFCSVLLKLMCDIEILKKMMNLNKYWCGMIVLAILILGGLTACDNGSDKPRVVVCVPVYGQSLAMGEESELVTDIDGLTKKWNGRLVGEGLDEIGRAHV